MPVTSTSPLKLLSPAKINLFLHVLGQRKDGYHEIETLFQFLDLSDSLEFELTDNGKVSREDRHTFTLPQEDLIIQAALRLKETGKQPADRGAHIVLRKQIPPGAGLGGGSSNAATTLIALNHLWKINLSRQELIVIGSQLGADIPVFLSGQASWATGIGDILKPFSPQEHWCSLAIPNIHVSTQTIFSSPDLARNHPAISVNDFAAGNTTNDLQPVTALLYPQVQEALTLLSQYGNAKMSGSGSAVFVQCASRIEAEEIIDQLPPHIQGFIARSSNQHPLANFH